jgi:hypothetical protein
MSKDLRCDAAGLFCCEKMGSHKEIAGERGEGAVGME